MRGPLRSTETVTASRGTLAIVNGLAAAAFTSEAVLGVQGHHGRDPFYFALWFVWMLTTVLWTFGTPGRLRWTAEQRQVINDELVRAHQTVAAKASLAVAIGGLCLLSTAAFLGVPTPPWAVPVLTAATVVSAALTFGWLERRDD